MNVLPVCVEDVCRRKCIFFHPKKEIERFKLNKPGHNLSRRQTGKFLEFNFGLNSYIDRVPYFHW